MLLRLQVLAKNMELHILVCFSVFYLAILSLTSSVA